MNTSNWNSFIIENFTDNSKYKLESKDSDKARLIMVRGVISNSASFIRFEIDKNNPDRILKVEFGSTETFILCKVLYISSKEFNLEFVQDSWFDNEVISSGLLFNTDNASKLLMLLELPLERGWKETHFYFKNILYKVGVTYNVGNKKKYQELILKAFEEQDIPLPFDSLFKKLTMFLIESTPLYRNRIIQKEYSVEPIFK